jgi:hypothetical protein
MPPPDSFPLPWRPEAREHAGMSRTSRDPLMLAAIALLAASPAGAAPATIRTGGPRRDQVCLDTRTIHTGRYKDRHRGGRGAILIDVSAQ